MASKKSAAKRTQKKKQGKKSYVFDGRWKNELGSTMKLKVSGQKITGSYKTAKSSDGGPLPPHPLIGFIDKNLISFVVNWKDEDSITAWVGQMISKDEIFTMWQMTKEVDDPAQDYWESILVGSDSFTRS